MINRLNMVARLVDEPTERVTRNGTKTVTGRVACQRSYKNREGNYETDFFNYVIFGETGDYFRKALHKGMKATFEGRIEMRSYKDKDGNGKWYPEIVIERFEFPEIKRENQIKVNAEMEQRIEQQQEEMEMDQMFHEIVSADDGDALPF